MVITIEERGYESGVVPVTYKVYGIRGVWRRFEDAVRLVQIMLSDGMNVRYYTKSSRHNKQHQPVTTWSLYIESSTH